MSGYTLQDGTVVIPPTNVSRGHGGMFVPENVVGINQHQAQPQVHQQVMPQQAVIPPQQPQQVAGPPMQPMQQQVYQPPAPAPAPVAPAPAVNPAVNPNEGTNQPSQDVITMHPAPTPEFTIGGSQNGSLEATAAPADSPSGAAELEKLRAENANLKKARTAEVAAMVKKATGSAENKALLDQWAIANLSPYELKAVNAILASGSIVEVQDTLNSLVSRYNAAAQATQTAQPQQYGQPAVNPAVNPTNTPVAPAAGTYMSAQEYESITVNDPKYRTDANYAHQVDQRRLQSIKQERGQTQQSSPFGRR